MSDRRSFLRGLATLPLIGGSVAILGQPTAAAVPVTPDLMQSYKSWLNMEHRMLSAELAGYDIEQWKLIERTFSSDRQAMTSTTSGRISATRGRPDGVGRRRPRPARPWC